LGGGGLGGVNVVPSKEEKIDRPGKNLGEAPGEVCGRDTDPIVDIREKSDPVPLELRRESSNGNIDFDQLELLRLLQRLCGNTTPEGTGEGTPD
jgi:hypothetical protein